MLGTTQENPKSKKGKILPINETSILSGKLLRKSKKAAKIVPTNVHLKTILLSVLYEKIPTMIKTIAIGYKNINTGTE